MEGWLGCAVTKGLLTVTGHDIQTKREIGTRARGCREDELELVNPHWGFKLSIQYLDDNRVEELQRCSYGRLSTEEMRP